MDEPTLDPKFCGHNDRIYVVSIKQSKIESDHRNFTIALICKDCGARLIGRVTEVNK